MATNLKNPEATSPQSILTPSIQRTVITNRLKHITRHADETKSIKVENVIGFTQIPLGLAGPLLITGQSQNGTFFAPLATLEAALIASVSRGCKAFQACGGVKAIAMSEGMGRAPAFLFKTVDDAVRFYKRLPSLEDQLRKDAEATSRFAKLIRLTPHIIGTSVHVLFEYTCGDAAGQNMTTIATHKACALLFASPLGKELRINDMYSEAHFAADKQVTAGAGVKPPRGVQVLAWGVLTDSVCRSILRSSSLRIYKVLAIALEAAVRNGQIGNQVNTANVVAAMFIATGQDAACIVEGCWAHLAAEYDESSGDLTLSLFFPSLPVGTVGGGTGYPTQKEALGILDCVGEGRKWALAETVAAFALALDMSTAGAIASDSHASAHERLARTAKL